MAETIAQGLNLSPQNSPTTGNVNSLNMAPVETPTQTYGFWDNINSVIQPGLAKASQMLDKNKNPEVKLKEKKSRWEDFKDWWNDKIGEPVKEGWNEKVAEPAKDFWNNLTGKEEIQDTKITSLTDFILNSPKKASNKIQDLLGIDKEIDDIETETGIYERPEEKEPEQKPTDKKTKPLNETEILQKIREWQKQDQKEQWDREDKIRKEIQEREDNAPYVYAQALKKAGYNLNLLGSGGQTATGGGITNATGKDYTRENKAKDILIAQILKDLELTAKGDENSKDRLGRLLTTIIGGSLISKRQLIK